MALIDTIKYDSVSDNEIVWKYPRDDFKIGSQLIVNESQDAIFVKGGQVLDSFEAGTHTITTGNIPLLEKIINLPFGKNTPFTAEVWYINKTVKRDLKWGTPQTIQVMDKSLNYPVSVRAFGLWGIRIKNSRSFLTQIVGTQSEISSDRIFHYFKGEIIQRLSDIIATSIVVNNISIFQIITQLNELSELAKKIITEELERFGIELVNFNVQNISIPKEEMEKIQKVYDKTLEVRELSKIEAGGSFNAVKTFEILKTMSENPGDGGTANAMIGAGLGAGIGLGAGLPLGNQMGKHMQVDNNSSSTNSLEDRLEKLKQLHDKKLITKKEFEDKRKQIIKDL